MLLSLLREGDKYGYELIEEIKRKTDEAVSLKSGTLYPLQHSLEVQSFVTSYEKASQGGKIRKYYHLTAEGQIFLQLKTKEWTSFKKRLTRLLKAVILFMSNIDNYLNTQ